MKVTFRSKINNCYQPLNSIEEIMESHSSWGVDDNFGVQCGIQQHKDGIELTTYWSKYKYFISKEKDEDGYFEVIYIGPYRGIISQELIPYFADIKIDYVESSIIEYTEGESEILPIPEYNFKQFDLIWRMYRDLFFDNNKEKVAEAIVEAIMYKKQYNLLEEVCTEASDILNKLELLSEVERYDRITVINRETGVLYHGRYLPKNMNFKDFEHVDIETIKVRCKTSELNKRTREFIKDGKKGEGMYGYEIDNLPNILHTKGDGLPFVVINEGNGKDRFGDKAEHVSVIN